MTAFDTHTISAEPDATAPDGADVRLLLRVAGGSMAHFELAPGETTHAVAHRKVDEIWYVLGGAGEMWRKKGDVEACVALEPGVALTIPNGTHFQFRATGDAPLAAVAVTMPPWPGEAEAYPVRGKWPPTR